MDWLLGLTPTKAWPKEIEMIMRWDNSCEIEFLRKENEKP